VLGEQAHWLGEPGVGPCRNWDGSGVTVFWQWCGADWTMINMRLDLAS
jgi:hypothetical protein